MTHTLEVYLNHGYKHILVSHGHRAFDIPSCRRVKPFTLAKKLLPMKNDHQLLLIAMIAFACFLLASCAGVQPVEACVTGPKDGFFHGLLHGFITPISFVASLFKNDVAIYEVNNSGGWYDFGFLLGSGGWGFFAGNKSKD